jgi:proline iminopeptidase
MKRCWFGLLLLVLTAPIAHSAPPRVADSYFDNAGRADVLSGGVRMIPITTAKGSFRVWTKRVGNNPRIKVLLLHGGPAMTHEYLEAFDSYFPGAGIEYYYYDQLGSKYSDQPQDDDLWELARFVEEVEQVRQALGLGPDNFYLYGQSWGGLLALEYALRYQQNLKALVISNMVTDVPGYNEYAKQVLMPRMDQQALAEIQALEARKDFGNPRYQELLMQHFYVDHILRMPPEQWPEPVLRSFGHLNHHIYTLMQGPSELGSSGRLERWSRTADLPKITVPTLVIGARHDTMDPRHMEMMASKVRHGRYLHCPNGSHFALYDDQKTYFEGLLAFIRDVDTGRF